MITEQGLLWQVVITGLVTIVVISACMCVEWIFRNNKYLTKII